MSNKTPKENAKKIKSARKPAIIAGLAFLVIFSGLMIFSLTRESGQNPDSSRGDAPPLTDKCVQIGQDCITFETADSNPERMKGLSGRDSLPEKGGMLFVFDYVDTQCMWMKDMRFAIDMVWLDENKKIMKVESKVGPETYPTTYCADGARYVMELSAGTAEKAGLQQGQTLSF